VFVRAGAIVPLDDGWAEPSGACALHDDAVPAPVAGARLASDHAPQLLSFHCWAADGAAAGACVDDAGDGDGPVRHDILELSGARPGDEAILRWRRDGDFPAPRRVRVVLHGVRVGQATSEGGPVSVQGSVLESGPFDELRFQALSPA
jgi:hypothetical protein